MKSRLLKGPDDAVRLWWRLTAREETANGQDPFLMKGNKAAGDCSNPACSCDRHHEVPAKRGRGVVDRCRRCGALWQFEMKYVMRRAVRMTPRPHSLERRLVNLGDLGICIDQIPQRDSLPYGLCLLTDRNYGFVAEEANQVAAAEPSTWTVPPGGFTYKRVRTAVGRARRVLRVALEARGLVSKQVPVLLRGGEVIPIDAVEPLPVDVIVPADPLAWSGLLHELEIRPGALQSRQALGGCTRLSRSFAPDLGTVYREVPL